MNNLKNGEIQNANNKKYRTVVNNLAFTLLIFFALLFTVMSLPQIVVIALEGTLPEKTVYVIGQILHIFAYLFTFMFPVMFYHIFAGKNNVEPMRLGLKLPKATYVWAYIFAGLAIITAAALVNAKIINLFDFTGYNSDRLYDSSKISENYEVILLFISVALVPGFCEEFLFRGLVLSNLLPFGKTTAVLGSALLFGLMHQNTEQFFYATVAGIILGLVYVESKSIWCGTFLHLLNNLSSVFSQVVYDRIGGDRAERIDMMITALIFGLGVLSLAYIYYKKKKEKEKNARLTESGCYGTLISSDMDYTPVYINKKFAIRRFFSVPMIIYVVIAFGAAGLYYIIGMIPIS